jgi:ABC-type phosphate/phosphonate transport system permease subunit
VFKEFSDLRHIVNFKRVIFPISIAFFIYTFGWGITSPIFSIYIENVTGNLFLTGLILSLTTMMGIFLSIPFGIIEDRMNVKRVRITDLSARAHGSKHGQRQDWLNLPFHRLTERLGTVDYS